MDARIVDRLRPIFSLSAEEKIGVLEDLRREPEKLPQLLGILRRLTADELRLSKKHPAEARSRKSRAAAEWPQVEAYLQENPGASVRNPGLD